MNPESSISQVETALKPCYQSAGFYDLLNRQKDYAAEVAYLSSRIEKHKKSEGNRLLDVACGTGQHIYFLQTSMKCEGLDIDSEFLDICSDKLPGMKFHLGDMTNFQLADKFDVVTCLFSSIGYVKTVDLLDSTIKNMADHINPGGLLIIEPWYTPATFKPGHSTVIVEETDEYKIVRMNLWLQKEMVAQGHSHILVMNNAGIQHIQELHELALFTNEEYAASMRAAGLEVVEVDENGPIGRGLFVGRKIA
ncbi:MAG: class I SAM-dependent methyltransferase [Candidatus Obscuribacterales bacterium]|nr:class I SAM-dependent methyltransferase [Candidatus Obscuribacterales bacterium]